MTSMNLEEGNPCLKEQKQSYKCLNDNNFEHSKCEAHFLNYNTCKKFWDFVQTDRRKKGITPLLPAAVDRKQIKEEYITKFKP